MVIQASANLSLPHIVKDLSITIKATWTRKMDPPDIFPEPDLPSSTAIFPPADHSPAGLRAWIAATCGYLDITPTQFAKYASLAPSTINRFLRSDDTAVSLSARTIDILLEAARKVEKDVDYIAKNRAQLGAETGPFLIDITLAGPAAAGLFYDQNNVIRIRHLRIPIRAPFHLHNIFALEIADDHASPVFKKGSIVVACPFRGIGGRSILQPRDGDYVVVPQFVQEPGPFLGEWTIRRFVVSPSGGAWLVPINPQANIPDVFLSSAENYQNQASPVLKRPHSLVIESIQAHAVR
jgi:hypothetical protein